jgi:hypothetical protein
LVDGRKLPAAAGEQPSTLRFCSQQGARGTPTHRGMTDEDSELSEVPMVSRENAGKE